MKLEISRTQTGDKPPQFVVLCYLTLTRHERDWYALYGAPPLLRAPLDNPNPGAPLPDPLLDKASLDMMITSEGWRYEADDARVAVRFIEQLSKGCTELDAYWWLIAMTFARMSSATVYESNQRS